MNKKLKRSIISTSIVLSIALLASIAALAQSPIAENLEITTYRDVSVGGKLSAIDPDGDAVTFEITTDPVKGKIDLQADGAFVYTPNEGKKGKDYFGYRATDSEGNVSQEGTVIIKIEKQKSKVTYSDLDGDASGYAATMLAEQGIFIGEKLAGKYVFNADSAVTRAEFLAMCMEIADSELLTGVYSTGFADDVDIPAWAKPYVSTALKCGVISGYTLSETGTVFKPNRYITSSEAAVILNSVVDLTDVSAIAYEAVPTWAAQSAANLYACNISPSSGIYEFDATLTRADAAQMLVSAMSVLGAR